MKDPENPPSVSTIQGLYKDANGVKDGIAEISGEVTDSEKELERILKELEDLNKKLNDDKKDAARKAGIDARNHLDDLIRKLSVVEGNISVLRSDADTIIDEFKDLEKTNDVDALKAAIENLAGEHGVFVGEKDGYNDELTAIEEKEAEIDTPTTSGDDW